MTIPKKHHFLPQFYLKGFKIEDQKFQWPHIWMIPKVANPNPVPPAIIDTGCEMGYHDVDTNPNSKDRSSLEKAFQKIEDEQANVIREILKQKCISRKNKQVLALFISIMRCRVPSYKRYIERFLQDTVISSTRIELRSGRLPPPPPQIAEFIKERGDDIFQVKISNWMILLQMIDAAMKSDSPAILNTMHYSLVEAVDGTEFITCDSPVSVYVPDYEIRKPYGVGLVDKEIEISVPLNKNFLLLASWQDMPPHQVVERDKVWEFNRRTIIICDKFVYASSIFEGLTDQVTKLSTYSAGFDSQSLDYGRGFCHVSRFIPVSDMTKF